MSDKVFFRRRVPIDKGRGKTERIQVYVDSATRQTLKDMADERGWTLSLMASFVLERGLETWGKERG